MLDNLSWIEWSGGFTSILFYQILSLNKHKKLLNSKYYSSFDLFVLESTNIELKQKKNESFPN